MLYSVVNRYSGNFCFSAISFSGTFIVECTSDGEEIYFDNVPNQVESIGEIGPRSYLVTYKSQNIGKFENGIFTDVYKNVSPYVADVIQVANSGDYYFLDRNSKKLIKYSDNLYSWSFSLPGNVLLSNFTFRESEGVIFYYDNNNFYRIKDHGDFAKLESSVHLSEGITKPFVVNSGNYIPKHLFARAQQIILSEISSSGSSSNE